MSKALCISIVFVIALAASAFAQQEKNQENGLAATPPTMDMPAENPAAPATGAPQTRWPGWPQGWQGYQGQYPYSGADGMGCGMMAGMGGMGMGGMGMGGMGMGGAGMGGVAMPGPGPQGMGMYMGAGTTIQDLVQLVTLQDLMESILKLADIEERSLGKSTAAERQDILRELADIRKKIESLLQENRAQIGGSSQQ